MINTNKISKSDSLVILRSLKALMKLGNSLFQSLQLQIEIEDGKNKKILERIVGQIKNHNKTTEDMMFKFGLINDSERIVLENSKDTKKAIIYIINIREISTNFNKTMFSLLFFPIVCTFIGLAIAKFILPVISAPVNDLVQIAQIKKGIELQETLGIPSWFFYIHYPESIDYITIIVAFFIVFLFVSYKYLEINNPSVLYKIAYLKAYDDIPYIFTLMRSLNVGGMDIYSIANKLYKSKINKGWRILFLRIKKRIEQNKMIYTVFQEFGFPKQLSVIIKTSESSKSFWENFDDMIEYTKEVNVDKNKEIRDKYSGLSKMVGYSIVLYFLLGIFLLMYSMQNIVTAIK